MGDGRAKGLWGPSNQPGSARLLSLFPYTSRRKGTKGGIGATDAFAVGCSVAGVGAGRRNGAKLLRTPPRRPAMGEEEGEDSERIAGSFPAPRAAGSEPTGRSVASSSRARALLSARQANPGAVSGLRRRTMGEKTRAGDAGARETEMRLIQFPSRTTPARPGPLGDGLSLRTRLPFFCFPFCFAIGRRVLSPPSLNNVGFVFFSRSILLAVTPPRPTPLFQSRPRHIGGFVAAVTISHKLRAPVQS